MESESRYLIEPGEDFIGFGTMEKGRSPQRKTHKLSPQEVEEISRYLENPTHAGVWQLATIVPEDSPFSLCLRQHLERKLRYSKAVEISSGRRKAKIKLTKEKQKELENSINQKLSFLNYFFLAFHQSNAPEAENLDTLFTRDSDYEVILQLLNLEGMKKRFEASLKFFEQRILCDGFDPVVSESKWTLTKSGFLLLQNVSEEQREYIFVSCNKNALTTYAEFLKVAGRIDSYSLTRIFSPEERVFSPYFAFLRLGAPFVVRDTHVKQLFNKAFSEYESGNYTNCISTIGLIGEDYLTQTYETFFREVCQKGLTLGQIYDHIHSQISKRYGKKEESLSELKPIFDEIAKELKGVAANPRPRREKEMLSLLRKSLKVIQDDRSYFTKKVELFKDTPKRLSFFPVDIRENITDLIRYRNAVSHRTMIPIGSYEALRSVYCLISLVMWWCKEKERTNWDIDQDSILKQAIEHNTGVKI